MNAVFLANGKVYKSKRAAYGNNDSVKAAHVLELELYPNIDAMRKVYHGMEVRKSGKKSISLEKRIGDLLLRVVATKTAAGIVVERTDAVVDRTEASANGGDK